MIFKDPLVLVLLPVILLVFLYTKKDYIKSGFIFPSDEIIKVLKGSVRLRLIRSLVYVRAISIILVIIALARPMVKNEAQIKREGIGIVVEIDCSSTMLAEDLTLTENERLDLLGMGLKGPSRDLLSAKRKTRIDISREVAKDFIKNRPNDLIGIGAFAAEAFVVCPMTLDHEWAIEQLDRVKGGLIKDGTAIGSAILSGLNQLKDIKAKTKIIVLLTDGLNNYGHVSPSIATKAARSIGVKIYTIGIVSSDYVPYAVKDAMGRTTYQNARIDMNESVLEDMAAQTGGQYFRAVNMKSLRDSYMEIDRLEKTSIEENRFENYRDVFSIFALFALILLLLEIILSNTALRKIP